jgi:transglutaminase-like putative cysteine protease
MADKLEKRKKLPARAGDSQIPAVLMAKILSWVGNWQGWVNIVLLFIALEIAVLSIERARWITPQPSLTLVLILSILIIWLLVRSRLPGVVKHVLALVGGIIVTIWQVYTMMPAPETTSKLRHFLDIFQSWWTPSGALVTGGEKVLFAVFIVFLTWVIGYVSTWFILRKRNAWVAVFLGGVAILVNLSNLPGNYYYYFGLYLLAAIFLIIQTRMARHHYLAGHSTGFTRQSLLYLASPLLIIIMLAGYISWVTPEGRFPQLQTMIATSTLWKRDIEESKLNLFSAIPAKQALSTTSSRRDLPFKKEWHQSERVDFVVESERPSYWRIGVYDTYTSQGWESSPTGEYFLRQEVPWMDTEALREQDMITYTVTANMKTDVLLDAGGFISSDMPVLMHVGEEDDVMAITVPRVLSPGERYSVKSFIYSKGGDLSRAGENYPESIKSVYLQLPPELPEDIRRLSENITMKAKTPYDKVVAINNYLSRIPYKEEIEAPPKGDDGVNFFLFNQRSGYCLYYASAMAVMLRCVDVPSRVAVGYLPGDPAEEKGKYILRDRHYHTWTQVYFQGYGWIDLEATPSSTESPVTIRTPWVSESAIESLPQWNVWLTLPPYGIFYMPDVDFTTEATGKKNVRIGPLSFADELGRALLIIFSIVIIIVLLLVPFLALRSAFYRWLWHVERSAIAARTYINMCKLAAMVKLGPRPSQTPLEFAAVLAAEFPEEARAVRDIVQAYVENRFGRREGKLGLFEEAEILKARCRIYDALLLRLGLMGKIYSKR